MEIVSEATFYDDLINSASIVHEVTADLPGYKSNLGHSMREQAPSVFSAKPAHMSTARGGLKQSGKGLEQDPFDALLDADFDVRRPCRACHVKGLCAYVTNPVTVQLCNPGSDELYQVLLHGAESQWHTPLRGCALLSS